MRSTIGVAVAFAIALLLMLANAAFSWTLAAIFVWLIAMGAAAVLILRKPGAAPENRKPRRKPYGGGSRKMVSGNPSRAQRVIELQGRPVPKQGDS